MVSVDTIIVQNKDIESSNLDEDKVMMNIARGKYFALNPVAGRIWDLSLMPVKVYSIVNTLLEEYDVEESVCRDSVINFVEKMYDEDLIKVV